jgi:hypothetical protein
MNRGDHQSRTIARNFKIIGSRQQVALQETETDE